MITATTVEGDDDLNVLKQKLESTINKIDSYRRTSVIDDEEYWKSVNLILIRWSSIVKQCEMRRLDHLITVMDTLESHGSTITNQAKSVIFEKEKEIVERAFAKARSKTPFTILLGKLHEEYKVRLKEAIYEYRQHLVTDIRSFIEWLSPVVIPERRQTRIAQKIEFLDQCYYECSRIDDRVKQEFIMRSEECEIERSILGHASRSVESYCFSGE